jgi:hypothetical protein
MTLMKDLVTPEGRLKGSRINCHDVYDYLKHLHAHTEVALALQISHEEVLALIHYIVEHEEEVEANWEAFEAAAAKGNSPEVEAKLAETRARMQLWRQERIRQRTEDKAHERSAG